MLKFLAAAAMLASLGSVAALAQSGDARKIAQTPPAPQPMRTEPAFKGTWNGPTEFKIPGPGPKPGETMEHYFANLVSGSRSPVMLHVLVLGGSRGFHHDSVPAAMDAIYQAGKKSGLWQTEFATDYSLVNSGGGKKMNSGFQPTGLKDFDAVVVASASGDWGLTAEQKAALISFVKDSGKGLVVIHAGLDANHNWRDYIDMIGGEMTGHPFNTAEHVLLPFPLINENSEFPAVRHLPKGFVKQDELYVIRNWSRADVNVLLRIDASKMATKDMMGMLPPDLDIPIAWTKRYGKGRVFASSIGHHAEAFDDPDIATMYLEAVKWSLGLSEGDEAPHGKRN